MDIAGGLAGGTMMTVASQTLLAATGQMMSDSPSAIIIGAGPSGIAMAHEMKHRLAFDDFTVYEKSDECGGTWATNRYPGGGGDMATHLYCFSFNLNPHWSKEVCDRQEVLDYLNATVDKFDLSPHIHTSVEVVKAQWQEKSNSWSVRLKDLKTGVEFTRYATILISAIGGASYPREVKFEGMDRFKGHMFHTGRWRTDWGVNGMDGIRGKRVAVIGNGCSAAQTVPKLVKEAAYVKQYARSPQWYRERRNRSIGKFQQALYQYIPLYQRLHRLHLFLDNENIAKTHIPETATAKARDKVPEHARQYILTKAPVKYHDFLVPDSPVGCERRICDPGYLEALHASNLELVTEGIREITDKGIISATDRYDDFDVIILATGFQETQFLPATLEIIGAQDGVSLQQYWKETRGAQAYWGSLVSAFPNFGILCGPNTFPAHNSALFACEVSIEYLSRVLLAPILDNRAAVVTVRQAVEDRYNQALQGRLKGSVFEAGCSNWYVNEYGRNVASWPGLASNYWLQTWLKGGEGVVYKGGGGAWWINMVVRWVRSVRKRTWLTLLLFLISLRVRSIRARFDQEMGRYKPYEQQVEGYLAPLGPLRDGVGKLVFNS